MSASPDDLVEACYNSLARPANEEEFRVSSSRAREGADGGAKEMPYGEGDATFRALGGVEGIRRLVEAFYAEMDSLEEARRIRSLHPANLETSIDKLARFLCGWTGGPKLFSEKYGPIKIPAFHRHLPVGVAERDAWLLCMKRALDARPLPEDLREYMLEQLFVPAERIRVVVAERLAERGVSREGGREPAPSENAPIVHLKIERS